MQLSENFYKHRKLETLVENQTSYTLNNAALHVFETHQQASQVLLKFSQPVLASMLEGKKVMHLEDQDSFDFFPGESLILPSDEMMCIDFPEAQRNNPTRCLAMAISESKIKSVVQLMNESIGKAEKEEEWKMVDYNFHFTNDVGIYRILNRLLYLFTENHPSKDFFVDNMLQELIVRILQANQKKIYTDQSNLLNTSNRLAFIIEYIKENYSKKMNTQHLSEKACMSDSHFYRVFKNELGISPTEFINQLRIDKAAEMLNDKNRNITDVFLACGFESRSYFNRVFKRSKGLSPAQYQRRFK